MPNVASLINKINIKKLRNTQHIEPPKCNCINKTNYHLKEKSQHGCIEYTLDVYNGASNNSNISRNVKKVYVSST